MECLLIISQYYHSRHYFIVAREENAVKLYEDCRSLIEKFEDYKRTGPTRPYQYGDISGQYFNGLKHQRNVNDSGDIYFIPCGSIARALYEMRDYQNQSRREAQGYKKRADITAISEHHNENKLREIVSKHFQIL